MKISKKKNYFSEKKIFLNYKLKVKNDNLYINIIINDLKI
jgi:hypothetical protein